MPEVIGIDHIYIAVTDIAASARFYDVLFQVLGFRKQAFDLGGEPHIHYYTLHLVYVLRPARTRTQHDPYAPGLHLEITNYRSERRDRHAYWDE